MRRLKRMIIFEVILSLLEGRGRGTHERRPTPHTELDGMPVSSSAPSNITKSFPPRNAEDANQKRLEKEHLLLMFLDTLSIHGIQCLDGKLEVRNQRIAA
jgi:hypothetical protein